jgi:serine/threonine protein kinase
MSDLIHGDLNPKNILVFEANGHILPKLADFGFSFQDTKAAIKLPLTKDWNAPEVNKAYPDFTFEQAVKADIFSLGLIFAWLLSTVINGPLFDQSPSKNESEAQAKRTREAKISFAWSEQTKRIRIYGPEVLVKSDMFQSIGSCLGQLALERFTRFFMLALALDHKERSSNCSELLNALGQPR